MSPWLSPIANPLGASCLWLLPLAYAVLLFWQEWQFRQVMVERPAVAAVVASVPAPVALDATAVSTVLGLAPETAPSQSAQQWAVQACFVASAGLSKALLRDAQGARLYQVGDTLPGGSVLRRVEADYVVLWSKGREERLALQVPAKPVLHKLEPTATPQVSAISLRYLRPVPGLSE